MVDVLDIHIGDSGAVIPIQLHQATDEDPDAVFVLTESHTVKFAVFNKSGRVVIAETEEGVVVTDGDEGQLTVQIDADALTCGTDYAAYVRIYDEDDKRLTAPVVKHDFILRVNAD